MPPAYRFVDRWVVRAPIEQVYDTIGDVLGYERWWTDGSGEWTLEEADGQTLATLDWRPSVNHALIRHLTPVLRPLFRSNHNWAMTHGERQIREHLGAT